MRLEEAKTVKIGDHLMYTTENLDGNKVRLECVVKGIWGDPNKFDCEIVDEDNECGVTNTFAPVECFEKIYCFF